MAYVSKGTVLGIDVTTADESLDLPREYSLEITADSDDLALYILKNIQTNGNIFYQLLGFSKTLQTSVNNKCAWQREMSPSSNKLGRWALPAAPFNTYGVNSGTGNIKASDAKNFVLDTTKCNLMTQGGTNLVINFPDSKGRENASLFSNDIPVFTYNNNSTNPCSEFASDILPYILEGDTSKAENIDDLNAPKINFIVNIDTDAKGLYFNYDITGEASFENIVIQFFSYNKYNKKVGDEIESVYVPTGTNYETTVDYLRQFVDKVEAPSNILSNQFVYVKLFGENQNSSYVVEFWLSLKEDATGGYEYEITREKSKNGQNTLNVNYGKPSDNNDYTSQPDTTAPTDDTNVYSGLNNLTKTYKLDDLGIRSLGNFFWNSTWEDNIKLINNFPLENVISIKAIPYNIDGELVNLIIGNVDTNLNAQSVSNVVGFFSNEILVPRYHYNFLDTNSFTSVSIYIPFIGFRNLSNDVVIGKKIKMRYVIDVTTGSFGVCLYSEIGGNFTPIDVYEGKIGIDIPISSSNRAQVELAQTAGVANAGLDLAQKNVGGAASSFLEGMLTPFHTSGGKNVSSLVASLMPSIPFVMITRPIKQVPQSYGKNVGYVCGQTKKLGNLTGYTVVEDINLDYMEATQPQKERLLSILKSGIYINP